MGAAWDSFTAAPPARSGYVAHNDSTMLANGRGLTVAASAKNRDRFIDWLEERMAQCLRVLKPGGYALVWALPRTSHWTATALEDAGFEITDKICHLFGQGFPKGKACLKPGHEEWILCRRQAPRVLPLNIDECRIPIAGTEDIAAGGYHVPGNGDVGGGRVYEDGWSAEPRCAEVPHPDSPRHDARGRWPANVVLQHSPECVCRGTKRVANRATPYARSVPATNAVYGAGFGAKAAGEEPTTYAGPDGTEEVEDWACLEGGMVKTEFALLDGRWVSPLSPPPDLQAGVEFLIRSLRQSSAAPCTRSKGTRSVSDYASASGSGLSALPSFLACCPPCRRSCDELARLAEGAARSSAQQLADALARACRLSEQRHIQPDQGVGLPSSWGDSGRGDSAPSSGQSSTAASDPSGPTPSAETPCRKSDTAPGGSGTVCASSSTQESRTGGFALPSEMPFCRTCTGARIRFLFWLACRLSCDFLPLALYRSAVELPSCPVFLLDSQAGERTSGLLTTKSKASGWNGTSGKVAWDGCSGDTGNVSRFFYVSKADRADRGEGNDHPCSKSTTLMQWLVKLVTRPGETVLDPFCGSGSTGVAALRCERRFVGVERDPHYHGIALRRLAAVDGPLFARPAGEAAP